MTSSESPTHPDAPRAGGETPETRVDNLLRAFQNACERAHDEVNPYWRNAAEKERAILRNELRASLLDRPSEEIIRLVVACHDEEADPTDENVVILRLADLSALLARSGSALLARHRDGERDTKRLDWLERNAYQLSTVSEGEIGDGRWDVFPNEMDLDDESDVPHGPTIRAAIDAAMSAPPSPERAPHD